MKRGNDVKKEELFKRSHTAVFQVSTSGTGVRVDEAHAFWTAGRTIAVAMGHLIASFYR